MNITAKKTDRPFRAGTINPAMAPVLRMQIAAVAAGQCVSVLLNCMQMNSGIRLVPDATFRTAFPESTLYLKGAGGSLMYSYTEKRTAFFQPGAVENLFCKVLLSGG